MNLSVIVTPEPEPQLQPLDLSIDHFNPIPIELKVKIFSYFPFQTRLGLRGICTQWKVVIEGMIARMRSLKLFGNRLDVALYCLDLRHIEEADLPYWTLKDDELLLSEDQFCNIECIQFLANLFVDLETLIFYYDSEKNHECAKVYFYLPLLLHSLRAQLINLSLGSSLYGPVTESKIHFCPYAPRRILHEINQITNLRRLDLLVECFFHFKWSFDCDLENQLHDILPFLSRFSLPDENRSTMYSQIAIGNSLFYLTTCTHLAVYPKKAGTTYSEMHLRCGLDENADLHENVTHLSFTGIVDVQLLGAIECLRKYEKLEYLYVFALIQTQNMDTCFFRLLSNKSNCFKTLKLGQWKCNMETFEMPSNSEQNIPSVTELIIDCLNLDDPDDSLHRPFWELTRNSRCQLFCKTLAAWLPNLEKLTLSTLTRTNLTDLLPDYLYYFPKIREHHFTAFNHHLELWEKHGGRHFVKLEQAAKAEMDIALRSEPAKNLTELRALYTFVHLGWEHFDHWWRRHRTTVGRRYSVE